MTRSPSNRRRPPVPVRTQLAVYRQAGWLCTLCGAPTIFPFALKALERLVGASLPGLSPAYYNQQWRRDRAPLLDLLATCTDHVEAFSRGGRHDPGNFALACARCNQRKGDLAREEFLERYPRPSVTGRYGEPKAWDGLSSVFVVLARRYPSRLSVTERRWLTALEETMSGEAGG